MKERDDEINRNDDNAAAASVAVRGIDDALIEDALKQITKSGFTSNDSSGLNKTSVPNMELFDSKGAAKSSKFQEPDNTYACVHIIDGKKPAPVATFACVHIIDGKNPPPDSTYACVHIIKGKDPDIINACVNKITCSSKFPDDHSPSEINKCINDIGKEPHDVNLCADHVRPPHGGKMPPNDINQCAARWPDGKVPPHEVNQCLARWPEGKVPPNDVNQCVARWPGGKVLPLEKHQPDVNNCVSELPKEKRSEGIDGSKIDSIIKKRTEHKMMEKITIEPRKQIMERSSDLGSIPSRPGQMQGKSKGPRASFEGINIQVKPE